VHEALTESVNVIGNTPLAEPPARLDGRFRLFDASCNSRFLGVATVRNEDVAEKTLKLAESGRATNTTLSINSSRCNYSNDK
jgi:hypothetical protein